MKNKYFNESGFTLIEVLIAAMLLVFGLITFGIFSGNMVQKNALLERRTVAATAAQDKVEELKNAALNATLVVGTTADPLDIESGTDNLDSEGGTAGNNVFTRTWTIANSAAGAEPLMITVAVSWVAPGGVQTYTVNTLISQN